MILTNGDEYRVYNSTAPVPSEEKLFRTVSISKDEDHTLVATLSLLSKEDLQDKKIGRLWESHFIDRQVRAAIEEMFSPNDPAEILVRAVRKLTNRRLKSAAIRAKAHLEDPFGGERVVPHRRELRAGAGDEARNHDIRDGTRRGARATPERKKARHS